jgi:3-isopropylmalate/(R)-2-methylmalate dehydratase large subunit
VLTSDAPLVEQIIDSHAQSRPAGQERARPGDLVSVDVDFVYLQDGNSPTVARLFAEHGFTEVFDPERVAFVFDHTVLVPDASMADRLREALTFAKQLKAKVVGRGSGISHVVAMESGWFEPGSLVLGSDSHTCTGGAAQSLALGMGASDIAAAMVTGRTWLRVPETVWLRVTGAPHPSVRPKDVMLRVLGHFGQRPFLYKSVEWCGPWAEGLSAASAASVASMGVEMGAKCVFLPAPAATAPGTVPITPQAGGEVLDFSVDGLRPMVALPHSPLSSTPLDDVAGERIDYVFLGSCTNSRLEDIREAATVVAGRSIHPDVHFVVTPGSKQTYLEASRAGYLDILTEAGALVTPPGCGACVGTQGTVPATGERVLSTMNRNFKGRMGNPAADIYLSSPLVAAHTALRGRFPEVDELTTEELTSHD